MRASSRRKASSRPLPPGTRALLRRALAEDRARSDRTTLALFRAPLNVRAFITAQDRGVLSGAAVAAAVARSMRLRVRRALPDGSRIRRGTTVLVVEGDGRRVLGAERTMLNFLMHLSGVATASRAAKEAVRRAGGRMEIRGTRKTLPGLRDLEKLAITHGGGAPHRRDLASALLVKSNHLALLPVGPAIQRLRDRWGGGEPIEVEVRSYADAKRALAAGADELLLDNFSPSGARRLIARLRQLPRGRSVPIELSGGLTPSVLRRYAHAGANSASLGSLTHSAPALAFHLTIATRPRRPSR